MREADVGGARDGPHPWIVQIDSMSVAEARELGKILGGHGYTGHFLGGTVAENMRRYTALRKRLEDEGKGDWL